MRYPICFALLTTLLFASGCSALQSSPSTDVTTLHFDASGSLQDPSDLNAAVTKLRSQPSMLLIYIHGWKHGAASDDSNYAGFQQHFSAIKHSLQLANSPLRPYGVYVTWPARVLPGELDNLAYYYTRDHADQIAKSRSFIDTVVALLAAAKTQSGARVVLAGHSMGARIIDRAIQRDSGLARSADLVVLINTADDEASGERTAHAVEPAAGDEPRTPRVVWITSITDAATGVIFQKAEGKTAVGFSNRLRTHVVEPTELGKTSVTHGIAFVAGGADWRVFKARNQFSGAWWNVQIPTKIIASHNDILGPVFLECARAIYAYAVFPRPTLSVALVGLSSRDGGLRLARANDVYQRGNSTSIARALIASLQNWRNFEDPVQGITNHLELIRDLPPSVFTADLKALAKPIFADLRRSGPKVTFLEEAEHQIFQ